MKNLIFACIAFLVLTSCSEYQKVFKNDDDAAKYELAVELYEKGIETDKNRFLKKSLRLQEQIINKYRGKPQGQKLSFLYADTYYQLGDYFISGYQFSRFTASYPKSEKTEEAMFKSAKSYYQESPRYTLDQTDTEKGIEKLQDYLNTYPQGKFYEEANVLVGELQTKIEQKAYEIAKQYHHMLDYKAAIEAMDNFISDYPGSSFREKAYYYKFESAYLLAINSYRYLMEERLEEAEKLHANYIKRFPRGEYAEEASTHLSDIKNRLQNFKSETS